MSMSVCFYFQVHQPFRLRTDYDFFSIGRDHRYEDYESNKKIMQKVAAKCYLPANKLILKLINKYYPHFKVSYSISGVALEQFELFAPEVLESFQELVATGQVELFSETYYHSLAFIKSKSEFRDQVKAHQDKIFQLFGVTPTTFRNTELIYNNELAKEVEKLGFETILAEGVDDILQWRSPNFLYKPISCNNLKLLLKNYKLSDDIAFRFSNKHWKEHPLTVKKFVKWIKKLAINGEVLNLFMDYETFGEHHWKETGIFEFLEKLTAKILTLPNFDFKTPRELSKNLTVAGEMDYKNFTSWADESRDLSAWVGNSMQEAAIDFAYSLEKPIKESQDLDLIHTWRKLLTSDHYYYASTKQSNDGMIHNYFSPYESPHDAYIIHSNILNDLKMTLKQKGIDCDA